MPTAQPRRKPSNRSRWLLGVTGLVLLVVSIVMMASNAPASRAQTVRPSLTPTQLWHPAPTRPSPAGTVSLRLIDWSRPNSWVSLPLSWAPAHQR